MGEELFVIGSKVMVDVMAERRGFDSKVVAPLEIEGGGVSVHVEEGGIYVRVSGRAGR
jgi:predicted HAD superfamily phosphohydrolase YqeG